MACYPQPCNCGCSTPCPDPLTPCPDPGIIQPIDSSAVTYDGNNVDCASIAAGQTLNQVVEQLGNTTCTIAEALAQLHNFQCSDLECCSIDSLGDVVTPAPLSGDILIFDGTNWINEAPYQFSCNDLSGCSIDALADVDTTGVVSGDILAYDGTTFIPAPQYQFLCSELNGCSLDDLGNVIESTPISGEVLTYDGSNWVNATSPFVFDCSKLASCSLDDLGTAVTVANGLTGDGKSTSPVLLGGALITNTSFSGAYSFYFGNTKNYVFGDDADFISSKVDQVKFAHTTSKTISSQLANGYSANFKRTSYTIDTTDPIDDGQGLFNDNNVLSFYVQSNATFEAGEKVGNQSSYFQLQASGTRTITMNTGPSGAIIPMSNHVAYTQLDNPVISIANKVTVNHFANTWSILTAQVSPYHNSITNFYHLLLSATDKFVTDTGLIPNTYGIYQEGSSDANYFAGPTTIDGEATLTNASVKITGIPVYADNAAALLGGLVAGNLYRITGGGNLGIVY